MKIQKLLNIPILGSFFLLIINVSAGTVGLRVKTASKCQEICYKANHCHHYSYCNGICYLKKSTGWISTKNDGCTSGNYQGTRLRDDTDYLHGDLLWKKSHDNTGLRTDHAEECRKICEPMTHCWYYTYCNGYCYFKKKHGWRRMYDSACTTGDYKGTYKLEGVDYNLGDTY